MSGGSQSNTSSTSKVDARDVNVNNPYYNTHVDKNGNTTSNFKDGTAGQIAYDYVNKNISDLLNDYLNPSLDSVTNKAKLNAFNKQQATNLQNNIINPLANNNMVRSSQATNMYNNLSNQAADYTNELLANSQSDTWNMINNLMNMYTAGYTGMNTDSNYGLESSLGGANKTTSSNSQT